MQAAAATLGGLTDVIANAGFGLNKPLHKYSDDEWRLVVGVNLGGTFHTLRAAIPILLEAGGGSIVTVATLNATRPLQGEAPYSAAKAGVVNLTQTAALEYAPTIRANCVSPGHDRHGPHVDHHRRPGLHRGRRGGHPAAAHRHARRTSPA